MPISKRTGKRYAAGSHSTRAGWEPKTCTTCGKPVVISRQACWFHYDHTTNTAYAFHMSCPRRVTLNGEGSTR